MDVREVMNGIFDVLETACQWRALPKDLPSKSTVHDYLMLWDWDGTLGRVHHELYLKTRDLEGCEASPSTRPFKALALSRLVKHRACHRLVEDSGNRFVNHNK